MKQEDVDNLESVLDDLYMLSDMLSDFREQSYAEGIISKVEDLLAKIDGECEDECE